MNETAIPRSDCGTDLVDRTVQANYLPVSTYRTGRVTVATRPTCAVRYYSDRGIERLFDTSSATRPNEDA